MGKGMMMRVNVKNQISYVNCVKSTFKDNLSFHIMRHAARGIY
jgi:hypothetical protein